MNGDDREVCGMHDKIFDKVCIQIQRCADDLQISIGDIKWIIRISKWFLGLTGATLTIVILFTGSILVYVSNLSSRVSVVEKQQEESLRDRTAMKDFDRKLDERMLQLIDKYHNK
jgi:hypothetical protein